MAEDPNTPSEQPGDTTGPQPGDTTAAPSVEDTNDDDETKDSDEAA